MGVSARDPLEDLPSQALNPNFSLVHFAYVKSEGCKSAICLEPINLPRARKETAETECENGIIDN